LKLFGNLSEEMQVVVPAVVAVVDEEDSELVVFSSDDSSANPTIPFAVFEGDNLGKGKERRRR
jgi:hypothetical protein